MGEAFDRAGHFLGSAEAATKADVLKALEKNHPDAAEIRIRALGDQGSGRYGWNNDAQSAYVQASSELLAALRSPSADPKEGK